MSRLTAIRIPNEVFKSLTDRAKKEHRTISNLILFFIIEGLNVANERGSESDQETPTAPESQK